MHVEKQGNTWYFEKCLIKSYWKEVFQYERRRFWGISPEHESVGKYHRILQICCQAVFRPVPVSYTHLDVYKRQSASSFTIWPSWPMEASLRSAWQSSLQEAARSWWTWPGKSSKGRLWLSLIHIYHKILLKKEKDLCRQTKRKKSPWACGRSSSS